MYDSNKLGLIGVSVEKLLLANMSRDGEMAGWGLGARDSEPDIRCNPHSA